LRGRVDWIAVVVAALAALALVRLRVEAHWAIAAGALIGLLRWLSGV